MNKLSLVRKLSEETGSSIVAATNFLNALEEVVVNSLRDGDDVRLPGFLIMTVKDVPATTGRNPKNGEPIEVSARKKILIRAGKALKDRINK
ncbi:MAG: HU family DNA-binding protein [Alphaproteobacteria bacterium]|nr:HU family DNA-binding protein [Rickettsiales bacterium]